MSVTIDWHGDEWFERHRQALESSMSQAGDQIVLDLHESVNTPYPPASDEGDPPHRRTGLLAAGIRQDTETEPESITTYIQSSRTGGDPLIPAYLEGPGRTYRPYMLPMKELWSTKIIDVIHELYAEHFGA